MNPEPSLWTGWKLLGFWRGLFSSGGPWKKKSSSEGPSLSPFFESSIITTLGATISKTLAKALFSAWTTSLPCSAAAGATVGDGAATSGGAANIVAAVSNVPKIDPRKARPKGSQFDRAGWVAQPLPPVLLLMRRR